MSYENALRESRIRIPTNKQQVIENGKKAAEKLKDFDLTRLKGPRKTLDQKRANTQYHALRDIIREAEEAKEPNYTLPRLFDFKPDTTSVLELQDRYNTATDKLKALSDDHFGLDPDNISEYHIEKLLYVLNKIEKIVN
jgi:hypothetical protein